jgi:uncharacterized repeat protein (TIGR01451 family)
MKNLMVRTQMFRGFFARLAAIVLLAALLTAAPFHPALAATAPSLGTAQSFAVLGGSTVTNTGPSIIIGDLGLYPGTSITGFPPGLVTGGTIHTADAVAQGAQADVTIAYNNLAGQACGTTISADLGGMTLTPGVYCSATSMGLTGALTLDAQGDPNAVWVFQMGSTLTTASNSSVVIINGGQQCNVFWQVGSSATLGTTTTFIGNILALTSITLNTGATIENGRALARNGAVTMDTNNVAISVCGVPPVTPIPPTLGKAFSPATINEQGNVNDTSTLTITLSNADNTNATSASLTDTLPSGVVIAAIPNASTTCVGGTAATVGTNQVTLTGGTIPANSSCTVTVDVTAAVAGNYINSLAIGDLQTSNGSNAAPAVATLTVLPPAGVPVPPTLGKAFSPATINEQGNVNDTSTLTITLSNADNINATSASLTDTLPSGVLVVAGTASTTCVGGTAATVGTNQVTLSGGTIPANSSCTVTVHVTAAVAGSYFNSLAAGALQTSNGSNVAAAVATLTVNLPASVPPTLTKAFSPTTINAGGVSTLTITLNNPNSTVATLTAPLSDYLPCGVVIAQTPNATTTCVGGTLTANPGGSKVVLTGGSILANNSCTVTVNVTAKYKSSYCNKLPAGALQTDKGSNAAPAVATLIVTLPVAPTLSKTFSPATINVGGVSTLTITLSNASSSVAYLTAPLTDIFPSGVLIASPPSTTCVGGTLTFGTSTVTLTGGSIPANSSCTVTVPVTAKCNGSYCNKLPTCALRTSNGNNALQAFATLTVKSVAPTLNKAFSPATINPGGVSTLTITLNNPESTVANLTAPLTDYLPFGVVIAAIPNAGTSCSGNGGVSAYAGGTKVTLPATRSIPANGSCTVTVDVTAKNKGSYCNKLPAGALRTSNGNNAAPAAATLTVKTK